MSLAELLVWCALLGLVLLVLVNLLVPALRRATRTQIRVALGQEAVAMSQALAADLRGTAPAGLLTATNAAVLQPIADVTEEGTLRWQTTWVVYGCTPDQKLWREEVATSGSDAYPSLPDAAHLADLKNALDAPGRRILGPGVREFAVTAAPRVHLVLESPPEVVVWDQALSWVAIP